MDNKYVQWLEFIMLIVATIETTRKFWVFTKKAKQRFKTDEKIQSRTRDVLIISINILIGYIVPVVFLWTNWEYSWWSWWFIPKLLAVYVFISNLSVWIVIGTILHMLKKIEADPEKDFEDDTQGKSKD